MSSVAAKRQPGQALSVQDIIDGLAQSHPNTVFLIDPATREKVTFGQLRQRCRSVAQRIAANDVPPGTAVAYAASNSLDAAAAILAILYGGYIATAVNLVAGRETIAYVLEHSQTRLILANDAGRKALGEVTGALPPILGIEDPLEEPESAGRPLPPVSAGADALLMYTSGTTGRPKGVVHTHESLLAGGTNTAIAHQLTQADRGLCVLPFYHINGLCVTLLGALVSGGSLVIPPRFSVRAFWPALAENACSWFSVVPTQISYLLHETAAADAAPCANRVRFGRSASAPLSPDVQGAFEEKFAIPIVETMGLTETAAQILSNPLPPGTRKIGSPGIAFGNEVIIADSSQTELPRGVEGEVLVRGRNVMRCYLRNEDATRQALVDGGWLRTGDLGRMDEEGYVYITGRLKELIIKGGENIAPREIDEALYSHPDVVEAAAFAVACNWYGETVHAAVRLREGSTLSERELIELCGERLGDFKRPDRVHILPELPKGPSGKIQRVRIAEMVAATA